MLLEVSRSCPPLVFYPIAELNPKPSLTVQEKHRMLKKKKERSYKPDPTTYINPRVQCMDAAAAINGHYARLDALLQRREPGAVRSLKKRGQHRISVSS